MLTLVGRVTGFMTVKKLTARSEEWAAASLEEEVRWHNARFITITLDNSTDFHDDARVEAVHAVKFHFATPYRSWERGCRDVRREDPAASPCSLSSQAVGPRHRGLSGRGQRAPSRR